MSYSEEGWLAWYSGGSVRAHGARYRMTHDHRWDGAPTAIEPIWEVKDLTPAQLAELDQIEEHDRKEHLHRHEGRGKSSFFDDPARLHRATLAFNGIACEHPERFQTRPSSYTAQMKAEHPEAPDSAFPDDWECRCCGMLFVKPPPPRPAPTMTAVFVGGRHNGETMRISELRPAWDFHVPVDLAVAGGFMDETAKPTPVATPTETYRRTGRWRPTSAGVEFEYAVAR